MSDFVFTSESVTGGHPDKVADQISDAVLDEIIRQDPKGRVACETMVTTGLGRRFETQGCRKRSKRSLRKRSTGWYG